MPTFKPAGLELVLPPGRGTWRPPTAPRARHADARAPTAATLTAAATSDRGRKPELGQWSGDSAGFSLEGHLDLRPLYSVIYRITTLFE